mgnify:CR=1 FL=1
MTNPLIDQGSLLNWPAIKTEHITPALDELLAKASDAVAKVTAPRHRHLERRRRSARTGA